MDRTFLNFTRWYLSQRPLWALSGVSVETTYQVLTALGSRQFWIELRTPYSLGRIVLYEGDCGCWVDFDGENDHLLALYTKGDIPFADGEELSRIAGELIAFMTDNRHFQT